MMDIIVIGAGPAGLIAALRAADLGTRTVLVTRAEFGGMAANDGPVPVRTLTHAARLIREARQLSQYGIASASRCWSIPGCLHACARSSTMCARILLCARRSIL